MRSHAPILNEELAREQKNVDEIEAWMKKFQDAIRSNDKDVAKTCVKKLDGYFAEDRDNAT